MKFLLQALAVAFLSPGIGLGGLARAEGPDHYPNFAALTQLERAGIDYRITVRDLAARLTVLAIHGGRIEPGSSEVARAIAGDDFNLYLFEAIKPEGNTALHLTSTHFDEPQALELVRRSAACVSVHGFKEPVARRVCIGGTAGVASERLASFIKERRIPVEVELPCARFGGADPENILNRCQTGGVQLELSTALRDAFQRDAALLRDFAGAVRDAVLAPATGKSARP